MNMAQLSMLRVDEEGVPRIVQHLHHLADNKYIAYYFDNHSHVVYIDQNHTTTTPERFWEDLEHAAECLWRTQRNRSWLEFPLVI